MKPISLLDQFTELCKIFVEPIALLLRESAGRFSNPVCCLSKSGPLGLYVSVFWRSTKSGCKRVSFKADEMSGSERMEKWSFLHGLYTALHLGGRGLRFAFHITI